MFFIPIGLIIALAEANARLGPVCEWCRTRNTSIKFCKNCGGPRHFTNLSPPARRAATQLISQRLNRK